ncbi:MAG: single-stranded DNA-binding protein [Kouleothrix sp.]|nr:single-stranded DNA-binding protein [Kouleothrix sp.]
MTRFDCDLSAVWRVRAISNPQSPNGEKGTQTMKTNQFELSGFVGNPPDARFTPNGKLVVTFSLYTRERWSDGSGAAREKTQGRSPPGARRPRSPSSGSRRARASR